ncbi:hypothetical protein J7L06_02500 [Candidatus Bathyarchaeota archaeon]|nr:hypothetical protein [Candidatus Bathyarchaeota archaeon]
MVKYRVWVHPKRGSDYYYEFRSLKKAYEARGRLLRRRDVAEVEPPLQVTRGGKEKPVPEKTLERVIKRYFEKKPRKKKKKTKRQSFSFGFGWYLFS